MRKLQRNRRFSRRSKKQWHASNHHPTIKNYGNNINNRYIAMVCAAISLSLKNIKKLRYWNLAGALLFAFYSIISSSWPVVILNVFLSAVNIYHLFF